MDSLEESLIEDELYYKQRAIEFRREPLKYKFFEYYAHWMLDSKEVYLSLDMTVLGHPLEITLKNGTIDGAFSVNNKEEVKILSKDVEKFFDEEIDSRFFEELQRDIRYEEQARAKRESRNQWQLN